MSMVFSSNFGMISLSGGAFAIDPAKCFCCCSPCGCWAGAPSARVIIQGVAGVSTRPVPPPSGNGTTVHGTGTGGDFALMSSGTIGANGNWDSRVSGSTADTDLGVATDGTGFVRVPGATVSVQTSGCQLRVTAGANGQAHQIDEDSADYALFDSGWMKVKDCKSPITVANTLTSPDYDNAATGGTATVIISGCVDDACDHCDDHLEVGDSKLVTRCSIFQTICIDIRGHIVTDTSGEFTDSGGRVFLWSDTAEPCPSSMLLADPPDDSDICNPADCTLISITRIA